MRGVRVSYANVVATLALFVALGGTSYAVKELSGKEIEKRSIPGNRVKNDALGGKQVNESKLGDVPSAALADRADTAETAANAANAVNAANAANAESAANATQFGGQGPAAFYRYGSTIPSGTTIAGAFGVYDQEQDGTEIPFDFRGFSFPVPAPVGLSNAQVNFDNSNPGLTGDEDPSCTGSRVSPTAPPGKVCLYPRNAIANANSAEGFSLDGSRFGFSVQAVGPAGQSVQVDGIWAYTAP